MTRTRTSLLAAGMAGALTLAAAPAALAEETSGPAPSPAAATGQEMPATEVTSPAGEGTPAEKPFSKGDATDNGQPVAAGLVALPDVLTISGTTYYLNKDGQTYVTDMGRINAEPTAAEVDASKALLAQNSAEAARQAIAEAKAGERKAAPAAGAAPAAAATAQATTPAQAPAAETAPAAPTTQVPAVERGMGAQTGSNTAARGLFALVFASVAGAALFAFARRTLI
ncbi:hypothetical protein [Corynebacterium sp. UBA2622]|uniref:hypothetical protein n=1 Tax=Corynebacterium sp. UBA2622 TaxID=1946393 RepID=UPI0025C3BF03|nr:hypothetical protein [Corynebacterium sp. UBA2622]